MYSKVFVLAALALIQVSSGLVIGSEPALAAGKDKAIKDLDHLVNVAKKASNDAFKILWALPTDVGKLSSELIRNGSLEIRADGKKLLDQTQAAKKLADAANIDVTTCLGHERALEEFLEATRIQLTTCVNTNSNLVNTVVSRALGQLNTILEEVYDAERRLSKCGETETACINLVINLISWLTTDIPSKIKAETELVVGIVNVEIINIKLCPAIIKNEIALIGGTRVTKFIECVDDLINKKPVV